MQIIVMLTIYIFSWMAFSEVQSNDIFIERAVRIDSPKFRPLPISRRQIVERAYSALNYKFKLSHSNYSPNTINNECVTPYNWLRPYRLYNKINNKITSIPYKWGGYFNSLDEFEVKLKAGYAVGDVCTCLDPDRNWCIVPQTIGLDCSGFVSFAWATPYYVTSTMHKISEKILWDELRPGDALNKPGVHIILFLGFNADKKYIHGIESSTKCEGVCKVNERVYDLKREGYYPIRYKNIIE